MATQTRTPKAAKATAAKATTPKATQRVCAARPNGPYGIDAKRKCPNPTRRPSAALCTEHEALWRAEARRRNAAKKAVTAADHSKDLTPAAALESQLAASVAAFATPELAATAQAKRNAAKAPRSSK